jgi:hypothetical protein
MAEEILELVTSRNRRKIAIEHAAVRVSYELLDAGEISLVEMSSMRKLAEALDAMDNPGATEADISQTAIRLKASIRLLVPSMSSEVQDAINDQQRIAIIRAFYTAQPSPAALGEKQPEQSPTACPSYGDSTAGM